MSDRIKRIADFDAFREKAKELFDSFAQVDSSNKRLHDLFSLCICPGGRNGGHDKKSVEVFYGNRPIDVVTDTGEERLETAHGATLSYYRTDDGHALCRLYPAKSENQQPVEDLILLDYIKEPSSLEAKSASHWKMFISYMEATCIDGDPNVLQRLRIFYIKNFKQYIVGKVVQETRALRLSKEVLKYVLTIGLSGFLILIFTMIKGRLDDKQSESRYHEIKLISKEAVSQLSVISDQIKDTNRRLDELTEKLNHSVGASNNRDSQASGHNKN